MPLPPSCLSTHRNFQEIHFLFWSARTSCTTFGWSVRPVCPFCAKNLDHLYTPYLYTPSNASQITFTFTPVIPVDVDVNIDVDVDIYVDVDVDVVVVVVVVVVVTCK